MEPNKTNPTDNQTNSINNNNQEVPPSNTQPFAPSPQPNQDYGINTINPQPIQQQVNPTPQVTTQQVVNNANPSNGFQQPNNIQASDPGKVYIIASIVSAVLLVPLFGLIFAIIASIRSKNAGFSNTLAKVMMAINIVLLILISAVIAILTILMLPIIQARAVSNNFTNAVRAGDCKTAISLTNTSTDQMDVAYKYCDSLKKSIGSSQSDVIYEQKDNKFGFVYEIKGGTSKYLRIVVSDGLIDDVTVTNSMPGIFSSSENVKENTEKPAEVTQTQNSSVCEPLVNTDFTPLLASAGSISGMKFYTDTIFFKADSLDYQYPDVIKPHYTKVADFVKVTKKPFSITLSGSVYKDYNTQAGRDFAQKRSEKVKNELISAGVPASLIIVGSPKEYPYGQKNSIDQNIFRNVDIKISSTCNGA